MRKHLLTIALAMIALGGAVASTANISSVPVPIVSGPQFSTAPVCEEQNLNCSLAPGVICTVGVIPQYELEDETGKCTQALYFIAK